MKLPDEEMRKKACGAIYIENWYTDPCKSSNSTDASDYSYTHLWNSCYNRGVTVDEYRAWYKIYVSQSKSDATRHGDLVACDGGSCTIL